MLASMRAPCKRMSDMRRTSASRRWLVPAAGCGAGVDRPRVELCREVLRVLERREARGLDHGLELATRAIARQPAEGRRVREAHPRRAAAARRRGVVRGPDERLRAVIRGG